MRTASTYATGAVGIGGRRIEAAAVEAGRSFERASGIPGAALAFERRARGAATATDAATLRRASVLLAVRARHRRHVARARAQDLILAAVAR